MLPVLLADPLWWVAARLRRILTGLLVLALAVGAHGQAAAAAPAGDTALVAAPATTALPAATAQSIAMSTGTSPGMPTGEAQPRRVRAVDAEISRAEVVDPRSTGPHWSDPPRP